MIEIRYSENERDGGEVALSGTLKALQHVGQFIQNFLQSDLVEETMSALEIDPTPYHHCLEALSIRRDGGAVKVSVVDSRLEIAGDSEKLMTFAAWFNFSNDTPVGYHVHYDALAGEEWVHPQSISLIICVR